MIRVACPGCKSVHQVGEALAGKTVVCPRCRKPMRVPSAAQPAAASRPAPPPAPSPPTPYEAPEFEEPAAAHINPLLIKGAFVAAGLLVVVLVWSLIPSSKRQAPHQERQPRADKPVVPNSRPIAEVAEGLKSEDPSVRLGAVREIENRGEGDKEVLDALAGILKDPGTTTTHLEGRRSAARALGPIAAKHEEPVRQEAAAALQTALGDTDEQVRHAAVSSLGKLGKSAVPALATAVGQFSRDKKLALHAAEILAGLGAAARPALAGLQGMMETGAIRERLRIAAMIVRIDPRGPGVVRHLNEALKDTDEAVRKQALLIIVKMGPAAGGTRANLAYIADADVNAELRGLAQKALEKMKQ